MLTIKMFTVRDVKLEAYMQPFFMQSKGVAIRAFTETANDKNSAIGKNPDDFTLFELGTFNQSQGIFEIHITPIPVVCANELVKQ